MIGCSRPETPEVCDSSWRTAIPALPLAANSFEGLYHDRHNRGPGVRGHHVAKLSHGSRPGYTGDLGEPAMRFDPIVGSDGLI